MTARARTIGTHRSAAAIGVVAATLLTGTACASAADGRQTAEVAAAEATPSAPAHDATQPDDLVAEDPLAGLEEYAQDRADALWAAGYYLEDAFALAELWDVPLLEAKGRAGQLLLDGKPVPIAPGASLDLTDPDTLAMLDLEAYWDAGYTGDDGAALAALWNVDVNGAKVTAGRMLRDGQPLPIGPSGTPAP